MTFAETADKSTVIARTVCLHSDTPNVIEIAHCVHTALSEYL